VSGKRKDAGPTGKVLKEHLARMKAEEWERQMRALAEFNRKLKDQKKS
jgi:hypothetical protein